MNPSIQQMQNRQVRVFVSSTFKDMELERNYLVKNIFPELRKRCRERHIDFVDVDLRWGITEEQVNKNKVLPVCLAEINHCHPFFIGLLGQRYGWVPESRHISKTLKKDHPWLDQHRNKSITELEIVHGVLNNHVMKDYSFFFFRDPRFLDSIPQADRNDMVDDDLEKRDKLEHLKSRISASGMPVDHYISLEELGKQVLERLWKGITDKFPPLIIEGDESARNDMEHEAFALNRMMSYVPQTVYHNKLNDHLKTGGLPLTVIGESGMGKSSLLANWAMQYRIDHPGDFVFYHFIGISPQSTDYVEILRRIMLAIKQRYRIAETVPQSVDELRMQFPEWLKKVNSPDQMVLIIDGLNQLEDKDNALSLGWLPQNFPSHVRLIVSTLSGPALDEILRRKWKTLSVKSLGQKARQAMMEGYLKRFGKTLEPQFIEQILRAPQSENPLYTRVLLEELRQFGKFDQLGGKIADYLEAQNPRELFEKILDRLEEDYNTPDYDGFVADTLSFLWVSPRGLYESELLEIMGSTENPVPKAIWSPLYLALQEYLINRSGLLGFFHDYFRQAVKARYLSEPEDEFNMHKRLAEYFEGMFSQLGETKGYRQLSLTCARNALKVAESSHNDGMIAEGCLYVAGALISVAVGVSHENALLFKNAWQMLKRGTTLAERSGAKHILADSYCVRARAETASNPDFGNLDLLDKAAELYRQCKDPEGQRNTYFEKAVLGIRCDKWDLVVPALEQAEKLHNLPKLKKTVEDWDLQKAHIIQVWGEYYAQSGQWVKAVESLEAARAIYAEQEFHGGVCAAEGWLGLAYCYLDRVLEGMALVLKSLKTERDTLGSVEGVAKWLHPLGEYYLAKGEQKKGLECLWLCEQLRQEMNHIELRRTRRVLGQARTADRKRYDRLKSTFNQRKTEFGEYGFLWGLGPFRKLKENPILEPQGSDWEAHAVFNPAAYTDGETVYLFYRAQEKSDKDNPVSRIGLATSHDGMHFIRNQDPVLSPTGKNEKCGCEDPRIVKIDDTFYMTYTAFDGQVARLSVAVSRDMHVWEKRGPLFTDDQWDAFFPVDQLPHIPRGWTKSGAIYPEPINGYYWMFFGDTHIWAAFSRDLIKWDVVAKPVLSPRPGFFDSVLVEPGPPPVYIKPANAQEPEGILLGYNAASMGKDGKLRYQFGQALLAPYDPMTVLRRSFTPQLKPTTPMERCGQTPHVVFGQGLVQFKGKWMLYYGMADTRIGVAVADL